MAKLIILLCVALTARQAYGLLLPSDNPSESVEPSAAEEDDPFPSGQGPFLSGQAGPAGNGNIPSPPPVPAPPANIPQMLQTLVGLAKRLVDDVDRMESTRMHPGKGHEEDDSNELDSSDGPSSTPFGHGIPILNIIMARRGPFPGQSQQEPLRAAKFGGHSGEDDDNEEPSMGNLGKMGGMRGEEEDDKKSRHLTRPNHGDSDDNNEENHQVRFGGPPHGLSMFRWPFLKPPMGRGTMGDDDEEMRGGPGHRMKGDDNDDDDDDRPRFPFRRHWGPNRGRSGEDGDREDGGRRAHGGFRRPPWMEEGDDDQERRPGQSFGPRGGPSRWSGMNNDDDESDRRPSSRFGRRGDDDSEVRIGSPRMDSDNDDNDDSGMEGGRGSWSRGGGGRHGGPGNLGGRGGRGGRRKPPCKRIIRHLLRLLAMRRHHRWGPGGRGGGRGSESERGGHGFSEMPTRFAGSPMMLPFTQMGGKDLNEGSSFGGNHGFDGDRELKK